MAMPSPARPTPPGLPRLYGELAADALERGVLDHVVHVPIGDPHEEPWVALGFGRTALVAVRDLAPTGRPLPPDVEVRVAKPDELDIVDRLIDEEAVFHAAARCSAPTGARTPSTRCALS